MTERKRGSVCSLAEARLIELLTEVDLQYLVKREGALTEAINWESEVSNAALISLAFLPG